MTVLVRQVPLPVHCQNCGGGDTLSVVGLIIAGAAFVVALFALYIAAREHREFMKQLRARARFDLTIGMNRFDGDVHETEASTTVMVFFVGLSNVGDKAASETVLNVHTPASFGQLLWGTQTGESSSERRGIPTGDTLTMPDGEEVGAQMISRTFQRLSLRGRTEFWFMVDGVPVPCVLPIGVVVNSDDLPDDQEFAWATRTFYVRRKGAPDG